MNMATPSGQPAGGATPPSPAVSAKGAHQAQHTPGPWPITSTGDGKRYVIGEGLVDGPSGYEVAEVYSDDCDPGEALANANVISAAPEMLAGLDHYADRMCEGWCEESYDFAHFDDCSGCLARRLAAKARGGLA